MDESKANFPPFQRILVPLDGSPRAEAILSHVESLALCFGADLLLLRVIEPAPLPIDPNAYLADLEVQVEAAAAAEAKSYLSVIQEQLCRKGIPTRCFVEIGIVAETIMTVARRENSDLIAMASHGRSGLAHLFYGSVAEGVLQQVDRPLYLIRAA